MPSTYSSLHCHVVFGTKRRNPLIGQSWRPRVHEYIRKQEDHLRARSFAEELRAMLTKAGVEYDLRYFEWVNPGALLRLAPLPGRVALEPFSQTRRRQTM